MKKISYSICIVAYDNLDADKSLQMTIECVSRRIAYDLSKSNRESFETM